MQNLFDGQYPTKLGRDRESAIAVFKPFGSNPVFLVVEGEPRSKADPKLGGSRKPYRSDNQRQHKGRLQCYMRAIFPQPLAGNIAIACTFYRSSKRRIDVDNLLKQVLDSATGIIWRDDMQVTACIGILKMDRAFPRTSIIVGLHNEPSLDRSNQDIPAICRTCGNSFVWRKYPSSKQIGAFCSLPCKNRFGRADLRAPANCRVCRKPFQRVNAKQSLCSDACRLSALRALNKKGSLGPSFCKVCGVQVSRPEYRRCRKCFRAGQKELFECVPT